MTPSPAQDDHNPFPLADIEAEADRLIQRATAEGITIRLIGGLAIAQHRHMQLPEGLDREYADIDVVVKRRDDRRLRERLEHNGYVANRRFNNLHGHRRLLYYDEINGRQLDAFVGTFRMCHELPLDNRLELHPFTLSPADLLLTKLQVIEVNWKDIVDALTLVYTHKFGAEADGDVIGIDRLAEVTSRDWGWYTTFTDNLARVVAGGEELSAREQLQESLDRIGEVRVLLSGERKTLGWKARAAIGRRVAWYEVPEEVGSGGVG